MPESGAVKIVDCSRYFAVGFGHTYEETMAHLQSLFTSQHVCSARWVLAGRELKFDVTIWHGTTEHRVVIRARSAEEAMQQALLVLHLKFSDVKRMEAVEK
jgi:hypothetical protein